jgi:hypothetical protein
MMLWSGDSANIDEALQLLYIIDIIALWGEHKYKPFAGACIRRFEAELNNKPPPPLEDTLLGQQMEINKETFSWLFPEPQRIQSVSFQRLPFSQQSQNPFSRSLSRSPGLQSQQPLQRMEQLSFKPITRDYIIPERDYFIWLLDRAPYAGDLLIVRVHQDGSILPPLVVFNSHCWNKRDFQKVIKQERARIPDSVLTEFRVQQDKSSYVKNCVLRDPQYFCKPQIQFCAIIPMDLKAYDSQRGPDYVEDTAFGRFEELLALPQLIKDAEKANTQWCTCKALWNKHGPSMIQCDNLKCPVGWYHHMCVGLKHNLKSDLWLCKQCVRNRCSDELCDFDDDDEKIDKKIRDASDNRIQRGKTLSRVWEAHKWPSAAQVRCVIDRLSSRIIIKTINNTFDTVPGANIKARGESTSWAIDRNIPKVMMAVRPGGR